VLCDAAEPEPETHKATKAAICMRKADAAFARAAAAANAIALPKQLRPVSILAAILTCRLTGKSSANSAGKNSSALRFTGPPAQAAADATRMQGTYQEHMLLFSCAASQNPAHPDSAKHRPQHDTQGIARAALPTAPGRRMLPTLL
jgi:hypothetical protein